MKVVVDKIFSTIIECFFNTSVLDMEYFRRVIKNSNKYGQDHLKNGSFGGMKWINITVQNMLHLYGVMIRVFIVPSAYWRIHFLLWVYFKNLLWPMIHVQY